MAAIFLQGYVRIQSDYLWLSLRRMSTINLSRNEIRLSDWPARSGTVRLFACQKRESEFFPLEWRWNELAVEELFERAPGSVATPRRRRRIGAARGIDAASGVMGFSPDTKQPNRMLREWEETHARKAHESRVRSAVSTLSATFSGASASRRSPPVKPWQKASASPKPVDPSTPLETARAAYRARPTSSVGSARFSSTLLRATLRRQRWPVAGQACAEAPHSLTTEKQWLSASQSSR